MEKIYGFNVEDSLIKTINRLIVNKKLQSHASNKKWIKFAILELIYSPYRNCYINPLNFVECYKNGELTHLKQIENDGHLPKFLTDLFEAIKDEMDDTTKDWLFMMLRNINIFVAAYLDKDSNLLLGYITTFLHRDELYELNAVVKTVQTDLN